MKSKLAVSLVDATSLATLGSTYATGQASGPGEVFAARQQVMRNLFFLLSLVLAGPPLTALSLVSIDSVRAAEGVPAGRVTEASLHAVRMRRAHDRSSN